MHIIDFYLAQFLLGSTFDTDALSVDHSNVFRSPHKEGIGTIGFSLSAMTFFNYVKNTDIRNAKYISIFSVNIGCVEITLFTNCHPISVHVILRRVSLFSTAYVNSYVHVKANGHTTSDHFTLNNVSLNLFLTLVNKNLHVCFKSLVYTRVSLS